MDWPRWTRNGASNWNWASSPNRRALLETQAAREREALRALIAAGPEAFMLERRLPQTAQAALPRRLGIELLARRPDLQAARWRVEASLGRVAAGEAAFYPDLNLSGAIGLNAVSLGKLLRGASRTMLAGAGAGLAAVRQRAP